MKTPRRGWVEYVEVDGLYSYTWRILECLFMGVERIELTREGI